MISVTYIDLSADRSTPLMQLREENTTRSIHIAVSDYDANRLALQGFKFITIKTDGVAETLIKALKATVVEVVFTLETTQTVKCSIAIALDGKISKIDARPGEAVLLALKFDAPILVEEELFYAKNDTITLKERLRSMSTIDFGHAIFQ